MPDPHPYTINVPPPEGGISIPVGQELWIHPAQACTFCCTIGATFCPPLQTSSFPKETMVLTPLTRLVAECITRAIRIPPALPALKGRRSLPRASR